MAGTASDRCGWSGSVWPGAVVGQLLCSIVTCDPSAEYERVSEKYAPLRAADLALYVLGLAILVVASLFREVVWFFFVGLVSAAVTWELTKVRLRRNARHFADAGR